MKKSLFRLMACVLALAMVLSLAACSGDSKSSSSSKAESSAAASSEAASSKPAESSEASSEASSTAGTSLRTEKYASVEEFLADPAVEEQLESMMSSLGDDMDIKLSGEGDKLIYTFTFNQEVDIEATRTAMEEQMNNEAFASTFKGIAGTLSDAIEVTNPSVVVTYNAVDGTEIYSQEYTPE